MLQVKLDTGFNIEVEFLIAPFVKRFFSWFIDVVILAAYIIIINRILRLGVDASWEFPAWVLLLISLPYLLYFPLCEIFLNGQTVGKKAMQIKVISADGGHPSISQYLIRWVFRAIDFPWWILFAIAFGELPWWSAIFLFGGIGCLIGTPYSQRIGDVVAGTILIDTHNRTSWEDTVFTELASDYQPRYPQVMQLSDKDINTLKGIISAVRKKSDYDLSIRIAARIRSKLGIADEQDSLEFLQTLLKDYNYYSTR
ncbi:MAG TPA: RDD family protein [Puia sp.]|nr:RDD family protein [Puia sp.]